MQWLSVLLSLLELLVDYFTRSQVQKEANDVKQSTKDIRDNPRDFFDDGMLNHSDGKDTTSNTDTVPSDGTPRQP